MDDRFRGRRSPDRGNYARGPPPPAGDSYVPGGRRRSRSPPPFRRRSRTPPRTQADNWTPRARSPPGRYDARNDYRPRDARLRSPRREYGAGDDRYNGRARSPPPRRNRELSPHSARPRSPPGQYRERPRSPVRDFGRARSPPRRAYSPPRDRNSYRPRSRSPLRRAETFTSKTWRRRSISPSRRRSNSPSRHSRGHEGSGQSSMAASRRSSPRPSLRRPAGAADYQSPRDGPSDYKRGRAPPNHRVESPANVESMRSPTKDSPVGHTPPVRSDSMPYRNQDSRHEAESGGGGSAAAAPSPVQEGVAPPPPAQPSPSRYSSNPPPPPTGPSNPAFNRANGNNIPPSGPASLSRGGFGGYRGSRGGPGGVGGGRGSGFGGRGGSSNFSSDPYPSRDPHAPREPYDSRPPLSARGRDASYSNNSYRGGAGGGVGGGMNGSSTSSTYPRTQRFNVHAALSDLPRIKPEGERLPPLFDSTKAERLEEEAARLRKMIDDKAGERRRSLREWERLDTAVRAAGERSEVVEDELRGLTGEGLGMGGVAF